MTCISFLFNSDCWRNWDSPTFLTWLWYQESPSGTNFSDSSSAAYNQWCFIRGLHTILIVIKNLIIINTTLGNFIKLIQLRIILKSIVVDSNDWCLDKLSRRWYQSQVKNYLSVKCLKSVSWKLSYQLLPWCFGLKKFRSINHFLPINKAG